MVNRFTILVRQSCRVSRVSADQLKFCRRRQKCAAKLQSEPSLSTEKLKSVLRNTLLCGKVAEWAESQHNVVWVANKFKLSRRRDNLRCGKVAE